MDPVSVACSFIPIIELFLKLIRKTCEAGWVSSSKHCKDELKLFITELEKHLQIVKQIEEKAVTVGFKSKCLDILHDELRELFSSAKNLLSGCRKGDIQKLRESVKGKLERYIGVEVGVENIGKLSEVTEELKAIRQLMPKKQDVQEMACDNPMELLSRIGVENIEMLSKVYEEVKALREMMTKKQDEQEMVSKNHSVQINIFQLGQACDNQTLIDELITRVLADANLNLVVPTEGLKHKASPCIVCPALSIRSGILEESSALNEGAAKYVPRKEAETDFLTKEATGKDVLEEKGRKKALVMDMEREDMPGEDKEEGAGEEEEERRISEGHGEEDVSLLVALSIRSGMLEASSALNEGAAKYVPRKEAETDFLTKEATGKDVLEEKGRKKALEMDMEREDMPREDKEEGAGEEEEERRISEGHGEEDVSLLVALSIRSGMLEKSGTLKEAGMDFLTKKALVMQDMERNDVPREEGAGEEEEEGSTSEGHGEENVPTEEEEKEKDRKEEEAHKEKEKIRKEGSISEGHGEEDVEKDEKKGRKEAVVKDMEREDVSKEEEEKEKNKSNPNCNVELEDCKGKGKLDLSKLGGGQFQMIYKWHKEYSMRIVIGSSPMKVSEELGCCYFEVKLVEMKELGREMGMSCVGVGLASRDEFQKQKMAGKYSKSCGYVGGGVGEVYSENRVQDGPRRMGKLEKEDTLGIGLLRHGDKHCIFFTRNGDLKDCVQDSYIHKIACHGGFIPVISLASAHVQLHVDFHGPFRQLSELVAKVKASLRGKARFR